MSTLTELGSLCRDDVITKFNANRKMKKEPEENDKAVFIVEVSLRSLASELANQQRSLGTRGNAAASAFFKETWLSHGPSKRRWKPTMRLLRRDHRCSKAGKG